MNRWQTIAIVDVTGAAKPAGSKSYRGHSKAGKPIIADSSGTPGKDWRKHVAAECQRQYPGQPRRGPVSAFFRFYLKRPMGDYRSSNPAAGLKDSAPECHVKRPDVLKLTRAAEDTGTGILWHDDSQICRQVLTKQYADWRPPGVEIAVQAPTPFAAGLDSSQALVRAVLAFYADPANHLDADGPGYASRVQQDAGALAEKALAALDKMAGTL